MKEAVPVRPPDGLVAAQRATIEVVESLESSLRPGMSERELAALAGRLARERGATGAWTPIAVGAGKGNRVCHPDHPPTDRLVADIDLVFFDVTPDFSGWHGDYTRSVVVGHDAKRERLVEDCLAVERELIDACRPGMPSSELFHVAEAALARRELELLDLLGNVGHDLGYGAEVTGYIDPGNETPMWGAWAIEPHVGRDGLGAKFEDLVWLGVEGTLVVA
jgi:Xaa-Pro dipeptidase